MRVPVFPCNSGNILNGSWAYLRSLMIEGFRDRDRSIYLFTSKHWNIVVDVTSDLEASMSQLLRMLILLAVLTCAHGFHVASPSMSRIGVS